MRVKFGSMAVDGRGKLGGHVYSKNRGGAYVRTKVTPSNPQTTGQSRIRGILTSLAQGWRSLLEAERLSWSAAVDSFRSTNIFGDSITPSGINLFVRLNSNILNAGGTTITDPPTNPNSPESPSVSAVASAGGGTLAITFTPTPVPANQALVVEVTPQVSPGQSFLKNKYSRLTTRVAASTSPYAAGGTYVAKYGTLIEGQKIGIRVMLVDLDSGLASSRIATVITVAA